MRDIFSEIGVVIIGRNEGERLKRCISSIQEQFDGPVVYVDSGSTDGSVEYTKKLGVDVIDLDMSIPFTMSRGRNSGFEFLSQNYKSCKYCLLYTSDAADD